MTTTQNFLQSLYQQFNLEKREIDLILCFVLNINTAGLYIYERPISGQQKQQIKEFLQQREDGKPLAYITGVKSFWDLDFKVNQHTLIPRPETELIIELLLKWTDDGFSGEILDLGTGTGAIALSIAHERPKCQVTAIDYSSECIDVALYNQEKLQLKNVNIFQSNWFEKIKSKKFNYIVSNPPYITEGDPHLEALSHEPIAALTASDDGYSDLQLIIGNANKYLNSDGKLILEHGYNQSKQVQIFLKKNGYCDIVTHKDIAGNPRITSAALTSSNR